MLRRKHGTKFIALDLAVIFVYEPKAQVTTTTTNGQAGLYENIKTLSIIIYYPPLHEVSGLMHPAASQNCSSF